MVNRAPPVRHTPTRTILVVLALLVVGGVGPLAPLFAGEAQALSGGLDGGQYYFRDTDEADGPVAAWQEISGTGTAVTFKPKGSGANYTFALPLNFQFTFYGQNFTSLYAHRCGFVAFSNVTTLANCNEGGEIPSTAGPRNLIAPFWGNLTVTPGVSKVFYQTFGTNPNRWFVVEYQNFTVPGVAERATFQVLLYEATNRVIVQHQTVKTGDHVFTVGVKDSTGANGLVYRRGNFTLANTAIVFGKNTAPQAAWDTPQTVVEHKEPLTLSFWSADEEGDNVSYRLDWGDGSTVERFPATGETLAATKWTATHVWTAPGTKTVTLTTIDRYGASTVSTRTIMVTNSLPGVPGTPTGPVAANLNEVVTFTTTPTTDPRDDSLRYIFNWGDGSSSTVGQTLLSDGFESMTLNGANWVSSSSTTITNSMAYGGSRSARVEYSGSLTSAPLAAEGQVTLRFKCHGTSSYPFSVYATNSAGEWVHQGSTYCGQSWPTVSYTLKGSNGMQFQLRAASTCCYVWYLDDVSVVLTPQGAGGLSQTHAWRAPGTYNVSVAAIDEFGGVGPFSPSTTITISNQGPGAPVLLSSATGMHNRTSAYTLRATDPNGDPLAFVVNWGDNTSTLYPTSGGRVLSGSSFVASHLWATPGSYTVTVTATDPFGMQSPPLTYTISTGNTKPNTPQATAATLSATSLACIQGFSCTTHQWSATDPEGDRIYYTVVWGDGKTERVPTSGYVNSGTTVTPTHTYGQAGRYTVSVTATDQYGLVSDVGARTVTVYGTYDGDGDQVPGGADANDTNSNQPVPMSDVDADGDDVPNALEGRLCGTPAVRSALGAADGALGSCATSTDYRQSGDTNENGIPDALEPAVCSLQDDNTPADGVCREDEYTLPTLNDLLDLLP